MQKTFEGTFLIFHISEKYAIETTKTFASILHSD